MIDSKKQGQSLSLALHEEMSRPVNAFLRRESISKQRISKLTVEKINERTSTTPIFSRPGAPRVRGASPFDPKE